LSKISRLRSPMVALVALAVSSGSFLVVGTSPAASASESASESSSSLSSLGLAVGISPGTLTDLSPSTQSSQIDGIAGSGATWIRLGSDWTTAEPSPGSFNWRPFDAAIRDALSDGLNVLYVINGPAPGWARTSWGSPNSSAYSAYASAAVQRYAPMGVHAYEVWNEENLGQNWNSSSGASSSEYTWLLQQAYTAIHSADSQSFVVSGGLSPAGTDGYNVAPRDFLSGMYAAGAKGYFDAVGAHPYCWPASPTDPSTSSWNFFYNLPSWIYSVMQANGDGNKKVWLTEFGYPTSPNSSYSNAVSPQQQASYMAQAFDQAAVWNWVAALFVYSWKVHTDGGWDTYGLITPNGKGKPALHVFKSFAHVFRRSLVIPAQTTAPRG
jgi:hypothetical protein